MRPILLLLIKLFSAAHTGRRTCCSCFVGAAWLPRPLAEVAMALQQLPTSSTDKVFVAVLSGNVLGWLHVLLTFRVESGLFAEITAMVVDDRYRGRGIGRLLLRQAADWSRGKGATVLKVRSNVQRVAMHRFYRKAGFSEVKEQKVFERPIGPEQS